MAVTFCSENRTLDDIVDFNPHTLAGKLKEIWTTHADREAIVFYDDNNLRTSITNRELSQLCERFASIVRSNGIKKGDVVCNLLSPGIEREVANFGLILAGVVVMDGMNLDDSNTLFWNPINKAEATGIVVEPHEDALGWKFLKTDVGVGAIDSFVELYTGKICPTLKKVFMFRIASRQLSRPPPLEPALRILSKGEGTWVADIFGHDPACIFIERCQHQKHYKLVLRTHQEMVHMAERNIEMLRFVSSDIIYNDWPLSWLTGLPFSYWMKGCTMVKSTLVECPANTVVRETWDLLVKEKCTLASLQPAMIQMLNSHCDDLPEPHWRLRAVTTTYMVKDTVLDAIGVFTDSIIICYSHIEAGMVSRLIVDENNKVDYRDGCVGSMYNSTVRTRFDLAADNTPKSSKPGEIFLSGRLVCKGYFRDDPLTRCSFTRNGSFITGDLGYYDDNGMMYVMGRKVDAIIRRETAFFPPDIEDKVNQSPGIWKVKVVLVRDMNGIQQICACVVPRKRDALTIDRVKDYCRYQLGGVDEKDEDPHMPTYVLFFDTLPVLNGEVNRFLLAQMASDIIHRKSSGGTSQHSSQSSGSKATGSGAGSGAASANTSAAHTKSNA